MTEISLVGKTIVVTGASQGLGEGIAREAAASGAAGLCLTGRNEKRGREVAKSLSRNGTRAIFVPAELADPEACRRVIAEAERALGAIDGLVNAAGVTTRGTIEDTTVALWDEIFAVNLRAPFVLMQEAIRRMKKAGKGGSIVNVLSQSAHGGQPKLTAYATSKGALGILTKNVAYAVRRDRIRVNGLMIGWMDTPAEHAIQKAEGQPADWLQRAEAQMPFGRILRPDDVAGLTAWLLSDRGQMMTGALIDFDQNVIGAYD